MRIILPVILFLVAAAPAFGQADFPELGKVLKIKPLETTRAEVKRLFGADEEDEENEGSEDYEFEGLSFSFSYDGGDCGDVADWNVGENVVTEIDVYFADQSKTVSLKSLWSKLERVKLDERDEPEDGEEIDYVYIDRSTGMSFEVTGDVLKGIQILPTEDRFALLCEAGQPEGPGTAMEWFWGKFRDRWQNWGLIKPFANVEELNLSREDIFLGCPTAEDQTCPDESKLNVVTVAKSNIESDVIIYHYTVSGGKIFGNGANVIWDLTGVKPGTYTITGGADNGCGVCGTTQTKEVIVRECPPCGPKPK